jgi:hypothetical protein
MITGLRKGTSHAKLYTKLGWVPLKERRKTNKPILLHKILHDETPLYLLNEILVINIFIRNKLVQCYNTPKFCFDMTGFGNKQSLY